MEISFSLSDTSCLYITCDTNIAPYKRSDNYCMKLNPRFQSETFCRNYKCFFGCYLKSIKVAANVKTDNTVASDSLTRL